MPELLDGRGKPVRTTKKGSDFATLDQLTNAVWHLYGPLAQTLKEVMDRLAVLEDALQECPDCHTITRVTGDFIPSDGAGRLNCRVCDSPNAPIPYVYVARPVSDEVAQSSGETSSGPSSDPEVSAASSDVSVSVAVGPLVARPAQPLDSEAVLDSVAHEVVSFDALGKPASSTVGGLHEAAVSNSAPRRHLRGMNDIGHRSNGSGLESPAVSSAFSTAGEAPSTEAQGPSGVVPKFAVGLPSGTPRTELGLGGDRTPDSSHGVNVAQSERRRNRPTSDAPPLPVSAEGSESATPSVPSDPE